MYHQMLFLAMVVVRKVLTEMVMKQMERGEEKEDEGGVVQD